MEIGGDGMAALRAWPSYEDSRLRAIAGEVKGCVVAMKREAKGSAPRWDARVVTEGLFLLPKRPREGG